MNREMISHYGWIVVVTIILALMMAFATPFGSFVGTAVLNTTNGFIDAGEKATSEDNMQKLENKWEDKIDKLSNTAGFIENDNSTDIKAPSGEVLGTLEHPVQTGDYYIDGDMLYRYNYYALAPEEDVTDPDDNTPPVWKLDESLNGWGACAIDKTKSEYDIKSSINGQPVVSLQSAFQNCTKLTTPPVIPDTVTSIAGAFNKCYSLETAPEIPSSVTNLNFAFFNCKSLKTVPNLPSHPCHLIGTFANCYSLETVPELPLTARSDNHLDYTFWHCSSLKEAPAIPSNVSALWYTFEGCSSITKTPKIYSNVKDLNRTFAHCTSLREFRLYTDDIAGFTDSFVFWGCETTNDDFILLTGIYSMETASAIIASVKDIDKQIIKMD